MFGFYGNNINIDIINGGFMPSMPAFNCGSGFFGGMLMASLFGGKTYQTYNADCGCNLGMFTGADLVNSSTGGYDLLFNGSNDCNCTFDFSSVAQENSPVITFDSNNYFNLAQESMAQPAYTLLSAIFPNPSASVAQTSRANSIYTRPSVSKNANTNLIKRVGNSVGETAALTAKKYLGYNEKDRSYKLFTGGSSNAWCADFVTFVVKESYKNMGKSVPSGFGSSSVYELRQWGKNNNCYVHLDKQNNKKELLKKYVKVGDIAIYGTNKSDTSHTGIITSINYETGEITAINGNSKDGDVSTRSYKLFDNKHKNGEIYLKGVVMLPA